MQANSWHNCTTRSLQARRAFISPILTKSMKNLLQATKPGSLLFGEKLTEKIKTAKSMEKIGKEIKASPLPSSSSNNKKVSNPAPRRTLNWRGPYARQGNSYQGPKQYQTKEEEINNEVRLVAGRLSQFLPQWKKITSDSFVLNCVKGYEIPFLEKPPWALSFNKDLRFSSEDERSLENEIKKLIAIGAIVRCEPVEDQFLSPFFLVPKPNGAKRFILNLKCLNQFIKTTHFKIEDMRVALKLIYQNYFLCNLDSKDAYFLVKIGPRSRKFLRFKFKDQIFEFQCLPFGLCTSPYVYTNY
ncbi:GSCOCG00011000001-RA-CDS [Cotesia congregata]|nr:GSCOCG00011000001-RA-CDS [Cotesia congregata]